MNNVYSCGYEEVLYTSTPRHTQTYNVICDKTGVVLGDTKYQVSLLPIPGSRMVVSSTEIGIVRYQILPHGNVTWIIFL